MGASYATGSLSGYARINMLSNLGASEEAKKVGIENLVLEAKSKARRKATAKATTLLRIMHYTEWKANFAKFYLEEIEKIQTGEIYNGKE
jgi:hypothetical protein